MSSNKIVYSDINQNKVSHNNLLIFNLQDIEQSIDNILTCSRGERFFLPEFGCSLRDYLFELSSDSLNTFAIYEEIRSSILRWETRVKIIDSRSFIKFDRSSNTLYLSLVMEIPALNIKDYTFNRRVQTSIARGS